MTAFASPLKRPARRRNQGASIPVVPPTAAKPSRVVSVSARWLEEEAPAMAPPSEPVDAAVQTLIASARNEMERLRSSLHDATAHRLGLNETIHRIDDRLEIGAQMLQAFQLQIERIEHAVASAAAIEQRNQRLSESLCELLTKLDAA